MRIHQTFGKGEDDGGVTRHDGALQHIENEVPDIVLHQREVLALRGVVKVEG